MTLNLRLSAGVCCLLLTVSAVAPTALAAQPEQTAEIRQEIARLKKVKRERFLEMIVRVRLGCEQSYRSEGDAQVRQCFRTSLQAEVRSFIFAAREARLYCTSDEQPTLCGLRNFLGPDPVPTVTPTITPFPGSAFKKTDCPVEVSEGPVTCGHVAVPMKHGLPEGEKLQLAVAILHATGEQAASAPLFILSDDPGEGSLKDIANWEYSSLRGARDIVLYDLRGTGFSEPAAACPSYRAPMRQMMNLNDPTEITAIDIKAHNACLTVLKAKGIDLSIFTSSESAHDIDQIRQALGYRQIDLFGKDYGAHLAQVAMREMPEQIRSAILEDAAPMQGSYHEDSTVQTLAAFEQLFAACKADVACRTAYPEIEADLYGLLRQLDAQPFEGEVTSLVEGSEKVHIRVTAPMFYIFSLALLETGVDSGYQRFSLPFFVQMAKRGDWGWWSIIAEEAIKDDSPDAVGVRLAVFCNERTPDTGVDPIEPVLPHTNLAGYIRYFTYSTTNSSYCRNWPFPSDTDERQPDSSAIPAMLLARQAGSNFSSSLQEAAEVAKTLSNSNLFSFPLGYGLFSNGNSCAQQLVRNFLEDPLKRPDPSCLQELPPVQFLLPPAEAGSE